jgi:hypothetical protein
MHGVSWRLDQIGVGSLKLLVITRSRHAAGSSVGAVSGDTSN